VRVIRRRVINVRATLEKQDGKKGQSQEVVVVV
jgi:hypothetical protein